LLNGIADWCFICENLFFVRPRMEVSRRPGKVG
jgi:hypothetical protein